MFLATLAVLNTYQALLKLRQTNFNHLLSAEATKLYGTKSQSVNIVCRKLLTTSTIFLIFVKHEILSTK